MASPPNQARRRGTTSASDAAGALSPDVLFDVLLRFPAKDLCRLRAVCRGWRSLTSNPLFIRAHAARHRSPLLVARFRDDGDGDGTTRIAVGAGPDRQLLCANLDLACLVTRWNDCLVLDPATAATHALPRYPVLGDPNCEELYKPATYFAFGRAPATGEYKVLRMFNRHEPYSSDTVQLFDVFTINGGGNARWRVRSRDFFVEARSAVVVGGAVYFLLNGEYYPKKRATVNSGIPPDYVASLDIETEEWRRELQGPISGSLDTNDADDRKEYISLWYQLALGELKGALVLANHRGCQFILDLWFLIDFEKGLWVKEYIIETESIVQSPSREYRMKPLLVLDDGRLVIYVELTGRLLICDPETDTCTFVEIRQLDSIAIYTGSLLSLPRR
ncbi:unnamed protein product [Urochloa decumbens]|uniref:F-box domain-containing protein n=1 Tax=Urochloa decumbens TaxID=240449 RepID=A0ABC9FP05_9POAL